MSYCMQPSVLMDSSVVVAAVAAVADSWTMIKAVIIVVIQVFLSILILTLT